MTVYRDQMGQKKGAKIDNAKIKQSDVMLATPLTFPRSRDFLFIVFPLFVIAL